MKIKSGFMKRTIGSEIVVVPLGEASKEFRGLIKLNPTASEIWDLISEGQTRDEIVAELCKRYKEDTDATEAIITQSVDSTIETLKKNNIIED